MFSLVIDVNNIVGFTSKNNKWSTQTSLQTAFIIPNFLSCAKSHSNQHLCKTMYGASYES